MTAPGLSDRQACPFVTAPSSGIGPKVDRAPGPMLKLLWNDPCTQFQAVDRPLPGGRKLCAAATLVKYLWSSC